MLPLVVRFRLGVFACSFDSGAALRHLILDHLRLSSHGSNPGRVVEFGFNAVRCVQALVDRRVLCVASIRLSNGVHELGDFERFVFVHSCGEELTQQGIEAHL